MDLDDTIIPSISTTSGKKYGEKNGWVMYQEGGKCFHENLDRIFALLGGVTLFETKKVGITWFIRAKALESTNTLMG